MKRFKKFFLIFLIGLVTVVLTFGTFSIASAEESTSNNLDSKVISPVSDANYYFVLDLYDCYYFVFVKDSFINSLSSDVVSSFSFSALSLGGSVSLSVGFSSSVSNPFYFYSIPKNSDQGETLNNFSFSSTRDLFSFFRLGLHIPSENSEGLTYSNDTFSLILPLSSLNFTSSSLPAFYGGALVYSFATPPIVAGNFNLEWVDSILLPSANSSYPVGMTYKTYYTTSLYDVFSFVGYDEGYAEGLDQSKYGIFATAKATNFTFDTAPYEFPKESIILDKITYGISFRTIARTADNLLYQNDWNDTYRFSVEVQFSAPFVFSNYMIYVSQSLGFYSLSFFDVDGNLYHMTEGEGQTNFGYPVIPRYGSEDVVGKFITSWIVEFANPDYVGSFVAPFEESYRNGYNDGYDEGHDVGSSSGYSEGYSDGFNRGKEYSIAQYAADLTGWDLLSGAFSSIFEVFDINVFGFFSLGDVFGLVLVFGVVFFVFKLIRG